MRSRSSKLSARTRQLRRLYESDPRKDDGCVHCQRPASDPHHVAGRQGDNLFNYIWLCRECHDRVHRSPKWARELGLLK